MRESNKSAYHTLIQQRRIFKSGKQSTEVSPIALNLIYQRQSLFER